MNIKTIKLDINKKLYERVIAKQGDTNSRFLLFNLLDGALPFDLTNREVRAYGVKPDGTEVFNDLVINDATKGICTLELTSQTLAVPGSVKMELMVTENAKKLTSIPFELEVIESINSEDAIVSTNEFGALINGLASLAEYENYKNEIKAARGSDANLKARLDKSDSQMADIAINIESFKRLSDESDDSGRVTRAIQFAKDNNIKRIIANGNYTINTPIVIEGFDMLNVYGNGKFIYGNNLDKGGTYYPIFKIIASKNITFNIRFEGDGHTFVNNNRCAILCEGNDSKDIIENINIENCYFYNFSSFVIRFNSASYESTTVNRINVKNINVRNNKFYNIHTAILTINGGVNGLNVKNNVFEHLSGNAIKIDSQLMCQNGEVSGEMIIDGNTFKDFNPTYRTGTQSLQAVITLEERQQNIKIVNNTFTDVTNSESGVLLIQQGTGKTGLSDIEFRNNSINNVVSTGGMLISIMAYQDGEKHKNLLFIENRVKGCNAMEFITCNGTGQSLDNVIIVGNEGDEIKRLFNNLYIIIDGLTIKDNIFNKCNFLFIRCNESKDYTITGNKVKDCIRFLEIINATNIAKRLILKDNFFEQITTHTGALQGILLKFQCSNADDIYIVKDNILSNSTEVDNQVGIEIYHNLAKCVVENVNVGTGFGYGIVFRNPNAILKFSTVKGQKLAGLYTADNIVYGLENKFDAVGTYGAVRGANYKNQTFASWV